jgi:hypothetical protein
MVAFSGGASLDILTVKVTAAILNVHNDFKNSLKNQELPDLLENQYKHSIKYGQ